MDFPIDRPTALNKCRNRKKNNNKQITIVILETFGQVKLNGVDNGSRIEKCIKIFNFDGSSTCAIKIWKSSNELASGLNELHDINRVINLKPVQSSLFTSVPNHSQSIVTNMFIYHLKKNYAMILMGAAEYCQ